MSRTVLGFDQILGLRVYSESLLEPNYFVFKGIAMISRVHVCVGFTLTCGLLCFNTKPLFFGVCCSRFTVLESLVW